MRSLYRAGCLFLAGCTYDAEIIGDSPDHVQVVSEVLDALTRASSFDLALSKIEIREMRSAKGRYNSVTRAIRLHPVDDLDRFRTNTRHEICHAFDLQGDLGSADDPFWDFGSPTMRESYSKRGGRRETFALTCQAGLPAWSLVGRCTPAAEAMSDAREQLFDQAELPEELEVEWRSSFTIEPGQSLGIATGTTDGIAILNAHEDDSNRMYFFLIDPTDGSPAQPAADSEQNTLEVGALPSVGPWWNEFERQLPSGEQVGRLTWALPNGHTLAAAALLTNPGELRTRCVEGNSSFFWIDQTLWLVEQRGQELRFGTVTR